MLIQTLAQMGTIPGFHIHSRLVERLNLIPNEYLYYYYHSRQAVENILQSGQTRGELVANLNKNLFARLKELKQKEELETMRSRPCRLHPSTRSDLYARRDFRQATTNDGRMVQEGDDLGYARLALNLIEALGRRPTASVDRKHSQSRFHFRYVCHRMWLKFPPGSVKIRSSLYAIGEIPDHCLGLMKLVKTYEKLTIEAAVENLPPKSGRCDCSTSAGSRLLPCQKSWWMVILQRHGDYFPN